MGQQTLITARKYDWEGISDRVLAYYQKTIEKTRAQGLVK
jgi:hypothetical protein